jgi:uncharacterized coiled-coil DUF342 family protein
VEPELLQAFSALSKQLDGITEDIKEIKGKNQEDHDKLIKVTSRQEEIIRDVNSMGEKVRNLQSVVWKISLAMAGTGASAGGLAGYLFG